MSKFTVVAANRELRGRRHQLFEGGRIEPLEAIEIGARDDQVVARRQVPDHVAPLRVERRRGDAPRIEEPAAVRSTGNSHDRRIGRGLAGREADAAGELLMPCRANVTVAPPALAANSSGASSISRPSMTIDFSHQAPIGLRMPAEKSGQ